jgi:hypothetical protein
VVRGFVNGPRRKFPVRERLPAWPGVPKVVADGPLKLADPGPSEGVYHAAQPSLLEMVVSPSEVPAIADWFVPVL